MTKERFFGWLIVLLCLASLIIGVFLIIAPKPLKEKTVSVTPESLEEIFSSSKAYNIRASKDGVAIVNIYGAISIESEKSIFEPYPKGADSVVDYISSLRKNDHVKAIVLRINSPGGTIAATQEICEEIERAKQKGIKVVASMGDIAASGGYYVACSADKIVANEGTLTGSIGVIIAGIDLTGVFRKLDIKWNVIKSGNFKDILASWKEMSPEERLLLEAIIKDAYSQFTNYVAKGRNMELKEVVKLADGRIYTGTQAKANKLVDELGDLDKAVKLAAELAGLKGEPYIIKSKKEAFQFIMDLIDSKSNNNLVDMFLKQNHVPVQYMYIP
jgi:protease IV